MAEDLFKLEEDMENIVLYVQPAFNSLTDQVEYAEVLVRQYRSIFGADQILKFVKENGLEESFDIAVFEKAIKTISGVVMPYPIGINLCPRTITIDNIVESISSIILKYGVDPNNIIIEINEGTNFQDSNIKRNLENLHKLGLKIALDDFGVEQANLYSLVNYEFDILKIDKAFVGSRGDSGKNIIIDILKQLCRAFKMRPIIEGVENEQQLSNVTKFGYEVIQGFIYMKPVPLEKYEWI